MDADTGEILMTSRDVVFTTKVNDISMVVDQHARKRIGILLDLLGEVSQWCPLDLMQMIANYEPRLNSDIALFELLCYEGERRSLIAELCEIPTFNNAVKEQALVEPD